MVRATWLSLRRPVRLALFAVVVSVSARAEDPAARRILDRVRELDNGVRKWTDRMQELSFAIEGKPPFTNRGRELRLYERRVELGEHKVLVRVLDPPDVRDLGFLVFTYPSGGSEQWLYLPEFKRIRRVTGSVRNERFVGSDLTHNDIDLVTAIAGWTAEDASATLQKTPETVDGVSCHVIDLAPKRTDVGYERIRLWLGLDHFARRLDLFGDDDTLSKTITQGDVRNVGRIPVAHRIKVEAPQGTTTHITVKETRFNVGLSDECFSQATLENVHKEATTCRSLPPS